MKPLGTPLGPGAALELDDSAVEVAVVVLKLEDTELVKGTDDPAAEVVVVAFDSVKMFVEDIVVVDKSPERDDVEVTCASVVVERSPEVDGVEIDVGELVLELSEELVLELSDELVLELVVCTSTEVLEAVLVEWRLSELLLLLLLELEL